MQEKTFNAIRKLVYDKSGIYLAENKMSLVTSRLQKRLRTIGVSSYEEYYSVIKNNTDGQEFIEFINVISTNTTCFFREPIHFTCYSEILKRLILEKQKRIRVWCAAASTGEEPYTLAMCFHDKYPEVDSLDFKILATDISTRVLQHARAGVYKKDKLQDIPGDIRYKYLSKTSDDRNEYRINDQLRSLITFARLNLIEIPFPMHGPLDVVFCRNVMIYFDLAVKQRLLAEIYRLLRPGGYLFVGHSESISGINPGFKLVRPAVYCKK